MRIAFFDDAATADLRPLTWLRPACELVCGQMSLRERVFRTLNVTAWGAMLRDDLAETYRETHPEAHVNDLRWLAEAPTLLLNGRWLADSSALRHIEIDDAGVIDGQLAHVVVDPVEVPLLSNGSVEDGLYQIARLRSRVTAGGALLRYPWDLVDRNAAQLARDFADVPRGLSARFDDTRVAIVGPPEQVWVDPSAQVDPFVVLDARNGPVTVEAGVVLQPFTRLEGPCHVGRGSQLFRASVRGGTTIGPVCRVGGEVEASLLHGHVNKYHDGFLGHSYVCPWVNLGALSTNSDLKNDYSKVKVPLHGEPIDSGLTKVGCFLGDHTRTALGSLFNTGTSVGVMSMILPGGELLPRYIPSFASVWHGKLAEGFSLERLFAAAAVAMERRNCELTSAQQRLLRHLHAVTRADRENAIASAENRRTALVG